MGRRLLPRRAYHLLTTTESWKEIWEAGSYFERTWELLHSAEEYALFVGWQIDSRIRLSAQSPPFLDLIVDLCRSRPKFHAYFLIWDHAYFYSLEREFFQGRIWSDVHPKIHFIFDNRHPLGGAHHEKVIIVDGKTALCGGVDLCDERWDSPHHFYLDPRRSLGRNCEHHGPYHDLSIELTGAACLELQRHIEQRWTRLSSIPFPKTTVAAEEAAKCAAKQNHQIYFSRTIPSLDVDETTAPPKREIEFLILELIQRAERRIVIEGQYYWSEVFNDALSAKILEMKGRPFEVILILVDLRRIQSLTRHMAFPEFQLLERLQDSARHAGVKLTLLWPFSHPPKDATRRESAYAKPIYVHSKTIIIDDRYLSIGSANLATRAFRVDSEVAFTLEAHNLAERLHIRNFAKKLLDHWNVQQYLDHPISAQTINPRRETRHNYQSGKLFDHFPWHPVFDPSTPWLYLLKRRLRAAATRFPTAPYLGALSLSASLAAINWGLARWAELPLSGWTILYCVLLAIAWIFPLPFTVLAILITVHLGPSAFLLVLGSLWLNSLVGYGLARAFPARMKQFHRSSGFSHLESWLGWRRPENLLRILFDHRSFLATKLAYQGIYCTPLPWFILGSLLIAPGAVYLFCQLAWLASQ